MSFEEKKRCDSRNIIKFLKDNIEKRNEKYNGDDSWVDTPVPIPNTEVKHSNAEDSGDAKIRSCHYFFLL